MSKKKTKKQKKKEKKQQVATAAEKKHPRDLYALLCILCATFVVFLPGLQAEFVNWDDAFNIYENDFVLHFDIVGIFTSDVIGNYNPLTILVFAIEHALFGLNPKAFHLVNILLHLVNTFIIYKIFKRLGLTFWGCVLATALFGIHPMRVESVIWATELKDVLFGLFFLLSLNSYLIHKKSGNRKHAILSFLFFFIGLFAKIQMVTLPLTLVAIDYWLDKKIDFKKVLAKWPYFLGSLAFGILGILVLSDQGSLDDVTQFGFLGRLIVGGYSLIIYLIKFVYPYEMLPIYPYPPSIPKIYMILGGLSISYLFLLLWAYIKKWYALLFGNIFFLFNIMFMLQILNAGQGLKADRFTYIAYIGLFFLAGYYVPKIKQRWSNLRWPILIGSLIYIGFLMYLANQQAHVWKNSETLWTHVINNQNKVLVTTAYRNRGNYYRDTKQYDKALVDFDEILSVKKDDPKLFNSRAKLYFEQRKADLAIQDYSKGLSIDPNDVEMRINRGAALAMKGDLQGALEDLTRGLELDPNNTNGYLNRSLVYQTSQRYKEALEDVKKYVQLNPNNGDLWYEKGKLEHRFGNFETALLDLDKSLRVGPIRNATYFQLALVHLDMKNLVLARKNMDKAKAMGVTIDQSLSDRIYK